MIVKSFGGHFAVYIVNIIALTCVVKGLLELKNKAMIKGIGYWSVLH